MGVKFGKAAGQAQKDRPDYYEFKEGQNKFRLFGDIIPRYVYWKARTTEDGTVNIPMECLSFDRKEEKFTNKEKDYVVEFFPGAKCQWSYVINCLDEKGKPNVMALKKSVFDQIQDLAEKKLGDPTDIKTGWDCVVSKKRTGSKKFNVKYLLDVLDCEQRELTENELNTIKEYKTIDEWFPRQSPEDQKTFIEKVWFSEEEENSDDARESIKDYQDSSDDLV